MTWVLIGAVVAAVCVLAALTIGLVDELRRPPSNLRRMGVGLALVSGFAGIWLLITPVTAGVGLRCEAPMLVLAQYSSPSLATAAGCTEPMLLNTAIGLLSVMLAPVAVLATRSRVD
jgi:hypothetical protein